MRRLLTEEVAQVRIEHQVKVIAGRSKRGEHLARGAERQPVEVRSLSHARRSAVEFMNTYSIVADLATCQCLCSAAALKSLSCVNRLKDG